MLLSQSVLQAAVFKREKGKSGGFPQWLFPCVNFSPCLIFFPCHLDTLSCFTSQTWVCPKSDPPDVDLCATVPSAALCMQRESPIQRWCAEQLIYYSCSDSDSKPSIFWHTSVLLRMRIPLIPFLLYCIHGGTMLSFNSSKLLDWSFFFFLFYYIWSPESLHCFEHSVLNFRKVFPNSCSFTHLTEKLSIYFSWFHATESTGNQPLYSTIFLPSTIIYLII